VRHETSKDAMEREVLTIL